MAGRLKRNAIGYGIGTKRYRALTQDEIEKSDFLRDEAWGELEELLKKELSEEAMMELKFVFYKGTQKYLFVGKRK